MKKRNYLFYIIGIVVTVIVFQQFDFKLSYHQQQPLFLLGFDNFISSFSNPGGFIQYLSEFITSLYAFNLWGIISIMSLIIMFLSQVYIKLKNSKHGMTSNLLILAVWLVTTLLPLKYSFQIDKLLILLVSFALSGFWFKVLKKSTSIYVVLYSLLFSIVSFYLLGALGLILSSVFTILSLVFSEIDNFKKVFASGVIVLNQIILPVLFVKLFFNILPIRTAYLSNYSLDTLWLVLVLISIGVIFYSFKESNKQANSKAVHIAFYLTSVLLLVISIATLNKDEKNALRIDKYAANKDWDKALNLITENNLSDQKSVFIYNRALLNKELLLEKCFDIPQTYGIDGLFLNPLSDPSNLILVSDLYFDLGLINEAKHWGHEAYTLFHKQPRILKRLVEANIINGQYNTAYKYILLLKNSLVDRKWALKYESIVNHTRSIEEFPELLEKQKMLPTEDFFAASDNLEDNLINLLSQPNPNPMAFEYLMAYYLLNHKMGYVLKNISNFRKYNYNYLPKHIQEAVAVYLVQTKDFKKDLSDYQLAKDYFTKIKTYLKFYSSAKKGNDKARQELDLNFSDTYWYYMQLVSPLK